MNSVLIGGGEKDNNTKYMCPNQKKWNSIFDAMGNLRAQTLQRNRAQKA